MKLGMSLLVLSLIAANCTAEEPKWLATHRKAYEAEVERIRKAADAEAEKARLKYVKKLEDLKSAYTKAGNLEVALAMKAEIERVTPAKVEGGAVESAGVVSDDDLRKLLVGYVWRRSIFDAQGRATDVIPYATMSKTFSNC